MKKIFIISLISFLCVCNSVIMGQSSTSKLTVIDRYKSNGYTLANDYDFVLSKGSEKYLDREFYSSYEYVIVAFNTEYGVLDLDVYVDYMDGDNYIKDSDNTNYCVCRFSPSWDRKMKLRVKNYDSYRSDYSYDVTLLIFFK